MSYTICSLSHKTFVTEVHSPEAMPPSMSSDGPTAPIYDRVPQCVPHNQVCHDPLHSRTILDDIIDDVSVVAAVSNGTYAPAFRITSARWTVSVWCIPLVSVSTFLYASNSVYLSLSCTIDFERKHFYLFRYCNNEKISFQIS